MLTDEKKDVRSEAEVDLEAIVVARSHEVYTLRAIIFVSG